MTIFPGLVWKKTLQNMTISSGPELLTLWEYIRRRRCIKVTYTKKRIDEQMPGIIKIQWQDTQEAEGAYGKVA